MQLCRFLCLLCLILLTAGWSSFDKVKKLADAGDAEKQYEVGVMLAEGDGVAKNPAEANRYLMMAMQKRHLPAACLLIEGISQRKSGDESAVFMQAYTLILSAESDRSQYVRLCRDFPKKVFAYMEYLAESNFIESAEKVHQWAEFQVDRYESYLRKECDIRGRDLGSFKNLMQKYMKNKVVSPDRKKVAAGKKQTAKTPVSTKELPQNPLLPPEIANKIANLAAFPYQKQFKPVFLYQKYPAGASILWFKSIAKSNPEELEFARVGEDYVHYALLLTRNEVEFYFGLEKKNDSAAFKSEFDNYGFTMDRCGLYKIVIKRRNADPEKLVKEFQGNDRQMEKNYRKLKNSVQKDKFRGSDFNVICSRDETKLEFGDRLIIILCERVTDVKPVSWADQNFIEEVKLAAAQKYNITTITIIHKELEQFFRDIRSRNDRIVK